MVKRLLLCLLALLMVTCAVACRSDEPQNGGDEQLPAREGLVITADTVIVCDADYNEYVERAVLMLRAEIKTITGLSLSIVDDKTEPVEQEIVVGLCKRTEGQSASAPVSLQDQRLTLAIANKAELYCFVRAFAEHLTDLLEQDAAGQWHLYADKVQTLSDMPTAYDTCVRVLTQNLRYANDAGGNSVAERAVRFTALVEEYRPDIIGTQEATPLWTQCLTQNLSDEYDMIGVFRDGTGHAGDEANYVLYRKDRFELVDSGTFWLTDEPEEVGRVEGALCNRICTWAYLRDVRTNELLMIANTHLDHSNDNIRKAQIEVLLNELSTDIQSYPVLLTGDFNSLRNSDPYKAIEKAGLNDGEKKAWVNDSDLDYTCHLYRGHGDTIDYCFYTKQWTPLYARIVSDDYGGYVSDHYGVIVDVVRFGS
jgi:endonuclease/exonuclease/phosphatase family metal-dependent hydrolase